MQITPEMVKIVIRSSKTDQFRQGNNVLIARTNFETCPVAMLERYMAAGEIDQTSNLSLFRGIVKTKDGEMLRLSGSVCYSTMRDLFRKKLEALGHSAAGSALGPVELQLVLRQVYQTTSSNNMGGGNLSQQKMITYVQLKTGSP